MNDLPHSIEDFLRRDPAVIDYRLVSRSDLTGVERSIVYYVPSEQHSIDELKERFLKALPEKVLPDFWVPINMLPIRGDGDLDVAALAALPLVDEALLKKAETVVLSQNNARHAVSFVGATTNRTAPLYLDDLLPASKKSSALLDTSPDSAPLHPGASSALPISTFPAIAHGDQLPVDPDSPTILPETLLRWADLTDDRQIIHIQSDGSEISQSYPALLEDSRRIVNGLRNLGLQPGDKLILQLETSQDFLAGFWACQLGGFIPVPMSIAHQYTADSTAVQKLAATGELLKQSTILGDGRLAPILRSLIKTTLKGMRVESITELRKYAPDNHIHSSQPDDLALMLLTSGSTGTPKAVCQSHRALLARSAGWSMANGDRRDDVTFNWMPLDHVGGVIMYHLRDVILGCRQVHAPTGYILLDPIRWLDAIDRYRVVNSWAPNFAYGLICDQTEKINRRRWDLSCVRYFLNAGEAIVPQTARNFLEMLTPHKLSPTSMLPVWGMSETCSGVTFNDTFNLETTSNEDAHVVVGRPIPGFSVRIVDDKNQCVTEGTVGRLQVKGLAVTSGYYNAPDLTAQSFTDDGWFITGDLATLREGRVTITGRENDTIIINGVNYSGPGMERVLEEIEGVTRSYVAACSVNDVRRGGRESLAIFFVPEVSGDNALQALLKEIRGQLVGTIGVSPDYLVPLKTEAIPKTSIGKIQRKKLKQKFEAGGFAAEIRHAGILSDTDCLPSWFFRRIWKRCNPLADLALEHNETVLLLGGSNELNSRLEEKIHSAGAATLRIVAGQSADFTGSDQWQIQPQSPSDYQQLIHELQERNVRNVVCMWPCESADSRFGPAEEVTQTSLAVIACCQAFAGDPDRQIPRRIVVVTDRAQPVGGEQALDYLHAPVAGLVKALTLETPQAEFLQLDIDTDDNAASATAVVTELTDSWNVNEVAWRNGKRWVPMLEPAVIQPVDDDILNPDKPACFVITGGLGGIGLNLANYLLRAQTAHVLLIGRNALDAEGMTEKSERFNELAEMPGKIKYINVDVADTQNLNTAIENQLAQWKVPLAGIFHLAGSYHEKPMADETAASLQHIFRSKICGAVALSEILKDHPNAFLVNFSSIISIFLLGSSHDGAYAAANRFLDIFTNQLVAEGFRAYSFNWSAWRQTGMNQGKTSGDLLKIRGLFELPVEQALTSLRIGLAQPPGQMMIGLDADTEATQRLLSTPRTLVAAHSFYEADHDKVPPPLQVKDTFGNEVAINMRPVAEIPRCENGDIDFPALQLMVRQGNSKTTAPRTKTEVKLSEIWQRVLRLDSISVDWNFFEVGGQSLIATSLIAAVREEFSVDWTLSDIFSAPTIETQATVIDNAVSHGTTEGVSIPVAPRDSAQPLSSSQQRLWFLGQVEPDSVAYNIVASARFESTPDPDFIESCLNCIVARHQSLRTVFPQTNGVPRQKILDKLWLSINTVHLQTGQSLDDFMIQDGSRPFNLSEGPLIRATLVSESQGGSALLLTLHHIISDGWSMRVFFNEFSKLYSGENPESLPVLQIQYTDYALWQQSNIQENAYATQLDYWTKQLKGNLSGFTLPSDFPHPKIQTYNGARVIQHIPATLSVGARTLAASQGVTLFVMMLTVFKTLLARYTQREDVVVGTVIANRDYAQIQNLIGFFVNPLVLRSTVTPTLSFSELLSRVSQVTLDAYRHHDLPFERLVDQLQPVRDTSQPPLFQIIFDLRDSEIVRSDVDGLRFGIMEPDLGSSQYDLHVALEEDGEELKAIWEYNTDLYSESTIERLAENYQQLLSSILEQPEQTISELPLLSSTETALLDSWNESAAPFPDTLCMHQLFEQHARSNPDTDAVIFGEQRLSYAELNSRANQLAHYLREQGAGPDKIIAIYLDRSIDMVISVLAILKSGSAYLALDPTYPVGRLTFMLEDSGASLLLSNSSLAGSLPAHQAKVIEIDKDPMCGQPDSNPEVTVTPSNLAYVIYTSGSTGKPKGVLVEHHGWCNVAQFQTDTFNLVPGMRVLQFASLSFDASAMEFATAWGCGGTLCLGTQEELLPGPNLAKTLSTYAVEAALLPPTALGAMPDAELPDLKVVAVGGDTSSKELIQRWSKSGRRFFNLYGPTETTILASYFECFSDLSGPPPIGKPIPNMQHYVVNKQMKRLPIGMPGELCIGGEGVTRGYLNRPELTAERFVPNPFSGAPGRLYRSGDLVRHRADGNLEFLGRIDHQVKIRGYRVELGEIESQLRQFAGVAETVVVAHKAANGDQQLLAYVSPADSVELNRDALREHLRKALPAYMVPTQIQILDEMPLSSNGKVDRKALPSPESQAPEQVAAIQTYQSEMEKVVSTVWQQILQLETIDIHQNFFDLGGHSMKMAQVQTTLSQKLNRKVPLVDLFQYPTISTLAAHLGNGSAEQTTTKNTQHKSQQGSRGRMAELAVLNKEARKRI